jgi:hypothetical protein
MDEGMNASELLKEVAEENQTRKILDILTQCEAQGKTLAEAIDKVRALLNK